MSHALKPKFDAVRRDLTQQFLAKEEIIRLLMVASIAGEHMVLFVAKLDATAPDEALEATIEYVARIANAMSKELNPEQEQSAAQTLASWLAE